MKLFILLCASQVLATWHKPLPRHQSHANIRRDGDCTIESTCSQCYGPGNILCDNAGCFNPDRGEQCCKGGFTCVAKDNSCCDALGPGTPGKDGVVPLASATATPSGLLDVITCTSGQTNDECCSQNGRYPSLKWCSGSYPNQRCYNPKQQVCCSQGTVCEGEGCCGLVDASVITPDPTQATALPSKSVTGQAMAATTEMSKTSASATPSSSPNAAVPSGMNGALLVGAVMAGLGL